MIKRGLSERSVARFCETYTDIHATSRIPDPALDIVVRSSVAKVSIQYSYQGFIQLQKHDKGTLIIQYTSGPGTTCSKGGPDRATTDSLGGPLVLLWTVWGDSF